MKGRFEPSLPLYLGLDCYSFWLLFPLKKKKHWGRAIHGSPSITYSLALRGTVCSIDSACCWLSTAIPVQEKWLWGAVLGLLSKLPSLLDLVQNLPCWSLKDPSEHFYRRKDFYLWNGTLSLPLSHCSPKCLPKRCSWGISGCVLCWSGAGQKQISFCLQKHSGGAKPFSSNRISFITVRDQHTSRYKVRTTRIK